MRRQGQEHPTAKEPAGQSGLDASFKHGDGRLSAAWRPPGLLRRVLRELDDGRQDPVCEVFDSRQKTDGADLLHQVGQMLRGAFSYNRIEVTVKEFRERDEEKQRIRI